MKKDNDEFVNVGKRLKAFRKGLNLTQDKISAIVGTSEKYWSDVERGLQGPSREFILKIKRHFDISADYLLTGNMSTEIDNPLVQEYIKCPDSCKQEFVVIIRSIRKSLEKLERGAPHT